MNYLTKSLYCFIFIFLSCNHEPIPTPSKINSGFIEDEIQPYFDAFFDELEQRNIDSPYEKGEYSIRFAPIGVLGATVIGSCSGYGDTLIYISESFWDTADIQFREQLIFHELGHCVLSRDHRDDPLRDYSTSSWMTSKIYGEGGGMDLYSPLWREYYLEELFELFRQPNLLDGPPWINDGIGFDLGEVNFDTLLITNYDNTEVSLFGIDSFDCTILLNKSNDFECEIGEYRMSFQLEHFFLGSIFLGKTDIYYQGRQFLWHDYLRNMPFSYATPFPITFRVRNGQIYFYLYDILVHNREYVASENVEIKVSCDPLVFDKITVATWQ